MKSTMAKLGVLGLGVYVVSSLLKKAADAASSYAPRGAQGMQGYDHLMAGYNPLDEAIGCACGGSFADQQLDADGIGGFGSKLRKAVKKVAAPVQKVIAKPVQQLKKDIKKVAAPVQRAVKREIAQVKKLAITNPINALKASAQIVKRDITGPARLFGHKAKSADGSVQYYDSDGNQITEAQYNAMMAQNSVSPGIIYQDYDGNVISKEQYDALMAQQTADAGGMAPNQSYSLDQSQVDEPTYGMDQVAADLFANAEDNSDDNQQWIVASANDAANAAGFTDDTFPLTGAGANDLYDTWGYDPSHGAYAGMDQDPLAEQFLPTDLREQTMDAYAADQTSGDDIIMPAGEPAMPFTGDEFAVMYESPDSWSRGAAWSPEPDGSNYGNVNYGGQELPGFWQQYGGWDWNWNDDGLGALVARPDAHNLRFPASMVLRTPSSTYGFYMKPGTQRGRDPYRSPPIMQPILADKKGNLFVRNGGAMHRLGSIDDLCDGSPGMGCASFGRDMGNGLSGGFKSFLKKVDPIAKKIASRATPSGFLYERLTKNPKLYREYRKAQHTAAPYELIVGGTVLSVATLGAGSAAGAAAIAGGVAELGAQGYSDYKTHQAEKEYDKTMDEIAEQDRLNTAIASGDVIADSQNLQPSGGPAPGEIPGGDWPWEYPGDGVWADFLDLTDSLVG